MCLKVRLWTRCTQQYSCILSLELAPLCRNPSRLFSETAILSIICIRPTRPWILRRFCTATSRFTGAEARGANVVYSTSYRCTDQSGRETSCPDSTLSPLLFWEIPENGSRGSRFPGSLATASSAKSCSKLPRRRCWPRRSLTKTRHENCNLRLSLPSKVTSQNSWLPIKQLPSRPSAFEAVKKAPGTTRDRRCLVRSNDDRGIRCDTTGRDGGFESIRGYSWAQALQQSGRSLDADWIEIVTRGKGLRAPEGSCFWLHVGL